MTPEDLTQSLKSALPIIASWAGRLAFGGIVAYSLAPLWNAATNADALKDDTWAMRTMVEEIYRRPTAAVTSIAALQQWQPEQSESEGRADE